MAGATRLGDKCTGHDGCGAKPLATASPNVTINSKGAGRMTDKYESHGCLVHAPHQDSIDAGSDTVFINGLKAARVDDAVEIGGSVAEGSDNVFIGD
ncbi:MAG: PAAR domain-containing protein [Prevotella sp.]|nr:PAAR domain-containing protein [Prevotella sp.]